MSLVQFLRILAARKAIILATLLACFITATAAAFLLPPRYEATNRVLIDTTRTDPFTVQLLQTNAMGNYIATQLKLVKDMQTMGKVVEALGWEQDPGLTAAFESAGRPGGDIRAWLAQRLIDSTEAKFAETSSIIEISYQGSVPASTQRVAETIRDKFLEQNLEERRGSAKRAFASFSDQARQAMAEIVRAEEERTQYAKANGIVLQGGMPDFSNARLNALSGAASAPAAAVAAAAPSPARAQLESVRQQIAQASQTLGPNHPTIQALNRQRAVLEQQAAAGGGGMIGGTSRAEIESAYQAEKARVLAQADKVDRLNQMNQNIAVKREQYQKIAAKAGEMQAQAGSTDTLLQAMGETNLPDTPVWPNKPLVIGGSIAVGLVLGLMLALLVELLGRRVRSDEDLEYAAGAPVLAIVGSLRPDDSLSNKILNVIDRKGAARRRALTEA